MGVPLLFAGDVVGALIIQDLQHENRFTQDDLTIFAMLAPQIATAIRNAQQYTATQQALQAYNQEHFLLNTLLESIPEAVSFKDPQGRFIRASRSAAALTGHAGETFDGKTDFDILDSETAQHIRQVEQAVLDRGQPETGILGLIAGADGEPLWLHTSRIPIATTAGDPYGLLVVQRDVTELKQAEALAQKRAEQMKTAAEIALDTAGAMDQQALLRNTIHLVRERFGYDHASVFMIDAAGEYAELRESTGPAGEQLLRTGHRLAVGSKSIVGRAAAAMAPVMVNDMVREPNLLPNPLLPETRSEMAIPVQVEERLLGVIDLHSTQANAFTSEDMHVLRIIANQLAIALEKAALFATAQDTLRKYSLMQQINRAASANATFEDAILSVVRGLHASALGDRVALLVLGAQEVLHVQASAGFTTSRFPQVRLAPESCLVGRSAMEKRILAAANEPAIPGDPENDAAICSALAVPLLFRGEIIGVLSLESRRPAAYGESDYEVFKGLSNTLAGMFTNIRLVNQVRQQVVRERQLYEITSSVRRSVDMDTILETSTREIARALGARSASIRITAGADRQEPENGKETNQ
jgi:PAS domain S-box-containing protein